VTIGEKDMRQLPPDKGPWGKPSSGASPQVRSGPTGHALGFSTRLMMCELTVVPDGDEFIAGDPWRGQFVAMPEIGVRAIEQIAAGRTLGEVYEFVRSHTGEPLDVFEFADTLIELGFVCSVDGAPTGASPHQMRDGGRVGVWVARAARPLFSRYAWVLYGSLLAGCAAVLAFEPRYRPRPSDLFFLRGEPAESVAVVMAISFLLLGAHELSHWTAAQVEGIRARVTVSRRLYFFVLETDLTSVLALPRRRRFSPLLAGMAFDIVTLAALTGALLSCSAVWSRPTVVMRLISALIATRVAVLIFQSLVFLRTDLYAVLVAGTGCRNLTRVSQLLLGRRARSLSEAEAGELAAADPRDLRVASWYQWIWLGGMAASGWFLVAYSLPWTATVLRWTVFGITHRSPTTVAFWKGLLLPFCALAPRVLPVAVYVWETRARLRERGSG
jgi:putative peptide zinc metalloprotease protein